MARASFFQQPAGPEYYPDVGYEEQALPRIMERFAQKAEASRTRRREAQALSEMGLTIPGYEVEPEPRTMLGRVGRGVSDILGPAPQPISEVGKTLLKSQLEVRTELAKVGIASKEQRTKMATTLRGEFTKQSKTWKTIRDSYGRVKESSVDPSAAGDLALIFNYMKILDPGSVVRESEFANAAASGAWGSRLQAAGLKIMRGERLSADMRADFVDRANRLYGAKQRQHQQLENTYTGLATRSGVDPKDVVLEFGLAEEGPKGTTRFNVNGVVYDIPEAEVTEFQNVYPNAKIITR